MDLEPYLKIRISDISDEDIVQLENYCKSKIHKLDVAYSMACAKFQEASKEFMLKILYKKPPSWFLRMLAQLSGTDDARLKSKEQLRYFRAGLKQAAEQYCSTMRLDRTEGSTMSDTEETPQSNSASDIKQEKPKPSLQIEQPTKSDTLKSKPTESTKVSTNTNTSLGDKMRQTRARNMEQKSNIKLHHEYVYNDYTDGDWRFHSMDYAVIFGVIYENMSGRKLLITVIDEILRRQYVDKEDLIAEEMFNGTYKIGRGTGKNEVRKAHYFEKYNMYVATSFGIGDIIKFIEKLLQFSHLPNSSVKISFKE